MKKILAWINLRRTYQGLDEITSLEYVEGFDPDPILHSIHPEATYVRGSGFKTVQWFDGPGVLQVDLPDHVIRWRAEWLAEHDKETPLD